MSSSDKLFISRDLNYDLCRSFLIVSMMVTHIFEMFYRPDYNRNLTYFVTLGFVFLSGFTMGAIYLERVADEPKKNLIKLVSRSAKLLLIFIIVNAGVFFIYPKRFILLSQMAPMDIFGAIFLGTQGNLFGFDILIPIGWTSFFSWFLLRYCRKRNILIFFFVTLTMIPVIEVFRILDFYTTKLVLIGMSGCAMGAWASDLKWNQAMLKFTRIPVLAIGAIFILVYYTVLMMNTIKGEGVYTYHHILPSISIPFYVYLVSRKLRPNNHRSFKKINLTLSNNILFVYLFHILLINASYLFIRKGSLDFIFTLCFCLIFLVFNIIVCLMIDTFKSKSPLFTAIYSSVFKL